MKQFGVLKGKIIPRVQEWDRENNQDPANMGPKGDLDYKFIYFPFYGRASAMKFQLKHAGKSFEEDNVEMKDWPARKAALGGGGLPVFFIRDHKLVESVPISRCIAIRYKQYPDDPLQGYENDRLMNIFYETLNKVYGANISGDMKKI